MRTLNKEQIKAVALDVFKRYPKAQKIAITSDGQAFITDSGENAVNNHAKNNRSGKELQISKFNRDFIDGQMNSNGTKTAEELIDAISKSSEVAEVKLIIEAEQKGKKRKTILQAAEEKIKQLEAAN